MNNLYVYHTHKIITCSKEVAPKICILIDVSLCGCGYEYVYINVYVHIDIIIRKSFPILNECNGHNNKIWEFIQVKRQLQDDDISDSPKKRDNKIYQARDEIKNPFM